MEKVCYIPMGGLKALQRIIAVTTSHAALKNWDDPPRNRNPGLIR